MSATCGENLPLSWSSQSSHPMRIHDLRHTTATLLLTQGVHPRVVMDTLGHSQVSLTLDTYSHVIPGLRADAADRLDDAVGNGCQNGRQSADRRPAVREQTPPRNRPCFGEPKAKPTWLGSRRRNHVERSEMW